MDDRIVVAQVARQGTHLLGIIRRCTASFGGSRGRSAIRVGLSRVPLPPPLCPLSIYILCTQVTYDNRMCINEADLSNEFI